jgi:hypothetical protein
MFALFWIQEPVTFATELLGHAEHDTCPWALYAFTAHGVPTPATHATPAWHTAVEISFPAPHMLLTYDPVGHVVQFEHTAFDDTPQAVDANVVPSTHAVHPAQVISLEDVHGETRYFPVYVPV